MASSIPLWYFSYCGRPVTIAARPDGFVSFGNFPLENSSIELEGVGGFIDDRGLSTYTMEQVSARLGGKGTTPENPIVVSGICKGKKFFTWA